MRAIVATAWALLLAACAGFPYGGYPIDPGTPRDAVLAHNGPPTRVFALAGGGERLVYSLQPDGRQTWMVDLDAGGRVVRAYQALTFDNFNRIQPGWTMADIEREFGPPARVEAVASWNGPVWTWRWRDVANADMFYYVYFDERGVVQRAHQGMELRNFPIPFR